MQREQSQIWGKYMCLCWGEEFVTPKCVFLVQEIFYIVFLRNSIHGKNSGNQVKVTLCKRHYLYK